MKVSARKVNQITVFGKKIFEFKMDYIERSIEKDTDDDDFFISLNHNLLKDRM